MSLFKIVLGFVLTTMIGFVFVSPIYLLEKYIVFSTLDKYIDNVILKAIAVVAVRNAVRLHQEEAQSACIP